MGFEDMGIDFDVEVVGFVNIELVEYFVIEDCFLNGCLELEKVGVYFMDCDICYWFE